MTDFYQQSTRIRNHSDFKVNRPLVSFVTSSVIPITHNYGVNARMKAMVLMIPKKTWNILRVYNLHVQSSNSKVCCSYDYKKDGEMQCNFCSIWGANKFKYTTHNLYSTQQNGTTDLFVMIKQVSLEYL